MSKTVMSLLAIASLCGACVAKSNGSGSSGNPAQPGPVAPVPLTADARAGIEALLAAIIVDTVQRAMPAPLMAASTRISTRASEHFGVNTNYSCGILGGPGATPGGSIYSYGSLDVDWEPGRRGSVSVTETLRNTDSCTQFGIVFKGPQTWKIQNNINVTSRMLMDPTGAQTGTAYRLLGDIIYFDGFTDRVYHVDVTHTYESFPKPQARSNGQFGDMRVNNEPLPSVTLPPYGASSRTAYGGSFQGQRTGSTTEVTKLGTTTCAFVINIDANLRLDLVENGDGSVSGNADLGASESSSACRNAGNGPWGYHGAVSSSGGQIRFSTTQVLGDGPNTADTKTVSFTGARIDGGIIGTVSYKYTLNAAGGETTISTLSEATFPVTLSSR